MKALYVGATLQDSGKTSTICGLLQVLQEKGVDCGYSKPVGQRYIEYSGENVDEDAVLIYEAFDFPDQPHTMSPIAIERGFTSKYINNPQAYPLEKRISDCHQKLLSKHDMVLVEGTGHAGVGACFGLSNARVAELLGANVIIVTSGGIGKPLDEIAVSLALFREHNVQVLGVILNKVLPGKLDRVRDVVGKGLEQLGTRLLGALPYEVTLSQYTIGQVATAFNYEVIAGQKSLTNHIRHVVVAAMEPQNVIEYIRSHAIIITPGDRIDNILLTLTLAGTSDFHDMFHSGGMILTGGLKPDPTILSLLQRSNIPVLFTEEDTYTVTARMKDLEFKIQTFDRDKIAKTKALVNDHVDLEYILNSLKE